MKIFLLENEIRKKGKEYLRYFRDICISPGPFEGRSEKLLLKEGDCMEIHFYLLNENIITERILEGEKRIFLENIN